MSANVIGCPKQILSLQSCENFPMSLRYQLGAQHLGLSTTYDMKKFCGLDIFMTQLAKIYATKDGKWFQKNWAIIFKGTCPYTKQKCNSYRPQY